MKIYEEKELFKPSFIQKIMNKVPVDNVTIEINNLFAKNEKNLENITLDQILETAKKYNINLDLKYYQFRLDLFSSYLQHCLIDKKIDDAEINTLRHIQHILFLNEKDTQDLINQETEIIYDQETKEVVKDGLFDESEKEYLEKLQKDLILSDDIAYKIYDQNATEIVQRLAQKAIEDERFSQDEEDKINQLIKNLKVEITLDEKSKKALDVCRYMWQLENSGLSKFPSNISPTKSEKLSLNEIDNNINSINQTPEEKLKDYNITEIKKQAVQVYNESGLMAAIDFLKNFIESKNLEFEEFIRLIKEIIYYSKNEKSITEDQIIDYINNNLDKYPEQDDPKQQIHIFEILKRVNLQFGLQYLEGILGDYKSDINKSPDHIELFILLSEIYLKDKQSDKAFGLMQRANNLTTKIDDRFYFISKHTKIADMEAEICLNGQKKPQYASYLHYRIFSLILEIVINAATSNLSQFNYHKSLFFNKEGWPYFYDNEDINAALEELKIQNHKEALIKDIYDFAFHELPLKMGIPKEFLIEDNIPPLNSDAWFEFVQKTIALEQPLNKKPFLEHAFTAQFASKVVKKYYDMNI